MISLGMVKEFMADYKRYKMDKTANGMPTNRLNGELNKATIDNRRTFLATVKDSSAKVRDHRDMALRPSSPANQKEKLWRIARSST